MSNRMVSGTILSWLLPQGTDYLIAWQFWDPSSQVFLNLSFFPSLCLAYWSKVKVEKSWTSDLVMLSRLKEASSFFKSGSSRTNSFLFKTSALNIATWETAWVYSVFPGDGCFRVFVSFEAESKSELFTYFCFDN